MKRTTESVLNDLKRSLDSAKYALEDFLGGPTNKKSSALMNFSVWGRSVTFTLQGLRSIEEDFDTWYAPYVKVMEKDPLIRFFKERRNTHLKKGDIEVKRILRNVNFSSEEFLKKYPKPENAVGYFLGDENGGSGWTIRLPDGREEKKYVDLDEEIATASIEFINPPNSHLEREIKDTSVNNLCNLYLEYLDNLVSDAFQKFKKN